MDIDCDGQQTGRKADDGRCHPGGDTQDATAFGDEVTQYGIPELNAFVHGYVVFGNTADGKSEWPQFDPVAAGVQSLSVMVVVCGNKMVSSSTPMDQPIQRTVLLNFPCQFYGVFGDINGSDGEHPVVGEASIGIATACFGKSITSDNGHDEDDVLYIAFTGDGTKPEGTANWDADTFEEFEQSLAGLGDQLVSKIQP